MRRLFIVFGVGLVGCGGARYRMEPVGTGAGLVAPRGIDVPAGASTGMSLPPGSYDVALRFAIPRAQIIEWQVTCPESSVEVAGQVGETLAAYRTRRAYELHQEQARVAGVASSVVGMVAPAAQVQTTAQTPGGTATATATAEVPAGVVGAAVADAAVDPIVPPGDVGAGGLVARTHVELTAPSTCALRAVTDDATVVADFQVIRIHDLAIERRERERDAAAGAIVVRTRMHAQLVALGADEGARERRLAAEAEAADRVRREREAREATAQAARDEERRRTQIAHEQQVAVTVELDAHAQAERDRQQAERDRARAEHEAQVRLHLEAEARLKWEREAPARAQHDLELTWFSTAIATRSTLVEWLVVTGGANPHRREELVAQRDRERAERNAIHLRQREEQQRRHDERVRIAAELEQQRIDAALDIRLRLTGRLVAMGAVARPPMPALLAEDAGSQPFDGAVWSPGRWAWVNLQWQWTAGSWGDSVAFGDAGSVDNGPHPAAAVDSYPVSYPTSVSGSGSVSGSVSTATTVDAGASVSTSTSTSTSSTTTVTQPSSPAVSGGVTISIPVSVPVIHVGAPPVRDHRRPPPPPVRDHRR